jgi:LPS export ABC transporter protein LptC
MTAGNLPAGLKKWLLISLGVGVGILLALVLMRGRGTTPPPPAAPAVESPAEMVLTGVEFTEIEHEQQKWTLKASQARYFQNEQKTELKDVHLVLHMKSGEEVELQSHSGILYAGSKALELIGGVQARVARSFLLTTDYAFYDHERQRISSSAGVHVEGPELLLDGAEWEYMIAEQRGKVDGGVKAKLIFTPRLTPR